MALRRPIRLQVGGGGPQLHLLRVPEVSLPLTPTLVSAEATPLPPINNGSITIKGSPGGSLGVLRDNLYRNIDYKLLPPRAWNALAKWCVPLCEGPCVCSLTLFVCYSLGRCRYTATIALPRSVIETNGDDSAPARGKVDAAMPCCDTKLIFHAPLVCPVQSLSAQLRQSDRLREALELELYPVCVAVRRMNKVRTCDPRGGGVGGRKLLWSFDLDCCMCSRGAGGPTDPVPSSPLVLPHGYPCHRARQSHLVVLLARRHGGAAVVQAGAHGHVAASAQPQRNPGAGGCERLVQCVCACAHRLPVLFSVCRVW